ncbi:MAG TPA: hypothetical protein VGS97_14630 [Actinocrinis sp.]|uniref:hypothetical protein n=1 Tax=Actinocrinis sp. TaxID=1920516 RepID=UPI002DDD0316|nr:hypothetical protein [Actinocrinis sp.]HEV2345332.1 hypothetical protein [Actinocrinis sp.]
MAAQERSIVFPVMFRPFTPVAFTVPPLNTAKMSDAMVTSLAPEAATTPTAPPDHEPVVKAVRLTVIPLDAPSMETEPADTPYIWESIASESRVMPVEPMTWTSDALIELVSMFRWETVTLLTSSKISAGCPNSTVRVPTPTMEIPKVFTVTEPGWLKFWSKLLPATETVSPADAALTPSCREQYGFAWVPFPVSVSQLPAIST